MPPLEHLLMRYRNSAVWLGAVGYIAAWYYALGIGR